jgi:hypothetical protein
MNRVLPLLAFVFGLAAVACGVFAWQLHGELGKAEAELAARVQELAKLQAQLATAEQRAARPPDFSPADSEPTGAGIPAGFPTNATDAWRPGGGPRGEMMAGWRNSPEAQRLMAIQRRSSLDGRYAALFKKLNLSPADLEKFKSLLVDKQSAPMDVMNAAREQGLNPRENREQIQALIRNFEAETDAAIRATLGEAAYQQYQQYEQTGPQRGMVSQLEQRLSYSRTPLYGNQSEQLVNVLAASNGTGGRGRVTITDAVIAQSEGFLSAPQVEALRQLQQEQLSQAELRRQMEQTRRTNSGNTATPQPTRSTGP